MSDAIQALKSNDVFDWPEFIAFRERLGIPPQPMETGLVITLDYQHVVRIEHSYIGTTKDE